MIGLLLCLAALVVSSLLIALALCRIAALSDDQAERMWAQSQRDDAFMDSEYMAYRRERDA